MRRGPGPFQLRGLHWGGEPEPPPIDGSPTPQADEPATSAPREASARQSPGCSPTHFPVTRRPQQMLLRRADGEPHQAETPDGSREDNADRRRGRPTTSLTSVSGTDGSERTDEHGPPTAPDGIRVGRVQPMGPPVSGVPAAPRCPQQYQAWSATPRTTRGTTCAPRHLTTSAPTAPAATAAPNRSCTHPRRSSSQSTRCTKRSKTRADRDQPQ